MADCRMPEQFQEIAAHHLSPDQPVGLRGGRPRVENHIALKVIWYVLTTGSRCCDVPPEMSCSGETARTRLVVWQQAGFQDRVHLGHAADASPRRRTGTGHGDHRSGSGPRSGRWREVRAEPGGLRKTREKVHRLGESAGYFRLGAGDRSNRSDQHQIRPLITEEYPAIAGRPGRPRTRPKSVVADTGYDSESTRDFLQCLGIEPRIRRRGTPHGSRLGKVRWVVERTISWVKGLRRMGVSHDRLAATIDAFATLSMAVINLRIWHHDLAPSD